MTDAGAEVHRLQELGGRRPRPGLGLGGGEQVRVRHAGGGCIAYDADSVGAVSERWPAFAEPEAWAEGSMGVER